MKGSAFDTRDPVTRARAIDEVPEIEDLTEPKRKARPVPEDVLIDLFNLLPPHSLDALKATLFFGFRKTEIFSLKVGHVDFTARGIRLEAGEVKDNEDAFLPGSVAAMEFMQTLVAQARSRRTR
jgi:integrase